MISISLGKLLMTGQFGPVAGPVTRKQLEGLLGPPDVFGIVPRGEEDRWVREPDGWLRHVPPRFAPNPYHAGIWKYGSFEFCFRRGVAWMVCADHFDRLRGGPRIRFHPWLLRGRVKRSVVQAGLRRIGVEYSVHTPAYDPSQTIVRTASGVELLFIESRHESTTPLGLYAITRRWDTRDCRNAGSAAGR